MKRRLLFSDRAQGSPEFTVVVSFVLLVFLVMTLVVFQKQSETYNFQVFLDAKRVASTVASNINMISQNGHGYYRYFSLPEKLYGYTDYDINFGRENLTESFLWINYSDTTYSVPLITSNVVIYQNDLTKRENETNCVSNINGSISINGTCILP